MISVLSSSVVDHGFGSQWGKTIKCVFLASPLSMQHYGERAMSDWLEISIMCQSGTTCPSADCCFSELALCKSN